MRILLASFVKGDTRRYRVLHLFEQLQLLGIPSHYIHITDSFFSDFNLTNWDLAIFHRVPMDLYVRKIMNGLHSRGSIILSDFDDLIFDITSFKYINSVDFSDKIRARLYIKGMNDIQASLLNCEGSLASTDFLASRIEMTGKPAWIHRNAFSYEMLRRSQKALNKKKSETQHIVIGYASGTPTHNRDFELVKPVLIDVMKKQPKTELHLVGPLDPGDGWGSLEERIRRIDLVPWRELPQVIADFDINLAPLMIDNPFGQSKSEIKWMEAAMVEVPTIASPSDAFRFAIRNGENGLLARNEQGWRDGLTKLIEDGQFRKRIGQQAKMDVLSDYHPVQRSIQLQTIINDISMSLRGEHLIPDVTLKEEILTRSEERLNDKVWLPLKLEQEPSNLKLGLYSLRNRGLKFLLLSAWVYLRRLISPIIPFKKS